MAIYEFGAPPPARGSVAYPKANGHPNYNEQLSGNDRSHNLPLLSPDSGSNEQHQAASAPGHYGGAQSSSLSRSHSQRAIEEGGSSDMLIDDSDVESESEEETTVIHVEVRLRLHSTMIPSVIKSTMRSFIGSAYGQGRISLGSELTGWEEIDVLERNVDRVWVEEGLMDQSSVRLDEAITRLHVYQPTQYDALEEFTADFSDDEDDQKVSAASVKTLPSTELDGVWDTLVYADDLKARLLNYINSTILFSESDIDFNVIAWNRVILLHGPPGTGKTSLCRALAQKISVRLHETYRTGKLIEINSHSLFSKWFSESGKLVQRLFDTVNNEVNDEGQFVIVMIDEVESLTAARAGAMRGNEPSDSLRVVNALLTQLDKLRTRKNVLVMTTSNLADAIDEAFISRVDMQEYVPLPPPQAVYSILRGCLEEMMEKHLVRRRSLPSWRSAEQYLASRHTETDRTKRAGGSLAALAIRCHALELSGRTLRKMPVLAHARYLFSSSGEHRTHRIDKWIEAMNKIVDVEAAKKAQEEERVRAREAHLNGFTSGSDHVVPNGDGSLAGTGHKRGISVDRSEVGTLVGTKSAGEDSGGRHHAHQSSRPN